MKKHEVSVIIPFCTYRIKEAVGSLKNQKGLSKKEIIAVYDNPKDEISYELLRFLKINKVKVIINKENKGLAGSYNEGIKRSKFEKIFLMHEDCYPKESDLLINASKKIDEGFDIVNAMTIIPVELWDEYDYWNKILTFRYIGQESTALGKASLITKSLVKKIGFFNEEDYKTAGEDIDYAVRIRASKSNETAIKDIVIHNHKANKSSLFKVLKKEWQMGEAHGVCKRKYGFKRIGRFDLEKRILFLLLIIIGSIFFWPLLVLGILPFVTIPILHALKNYKATGWKYGLFSYPIFGILIIFDQTIAGIKGYMSKRQSSRYYGG